MNEHEGLSPKAKKRPWVTPRVLQVQRRTDGDNLAVGCKTPALEFAVDGTCEFSPSTCQDFGS